MATEKFQLPVIPLRDIVVFPDEIIPIFAGREKSVEAFEYAMKHDLPIILCTQKRGYLENPKETDIYEIGTVAKILQHKEMQDESFKILFVGKFRAQILKYNSEMRFLFAEVEYLHDDDTVTDETAEIMEDIKELFSAYADLNKNITKDFVNIIEQIQTPVKLINTISTQLKIKVASKQKLLEGEQTLSRLNLLRDLLKSENEVIETEIKIRKNVNGRVEQKRKDYLLKDKMQKIKEELTQMSGEVDEIEELREKILNKKMSEEAEKVSLAELKKLSKMYATSSEATVTRIYLDWLLSIPWTQEEKPPFDIGGAEKILEEDHYGLNKPKERILEYLAVEGLVKKMKGPILCFLGPPGVGKTSLGKSIARATGRKYLRVSLGGVRDEAEIRGHRRTYVGALPGKIIQQMKKVSSNDPVFMLDEVDKMAMDFRGDPAAALLEVLDPEQNHTFMDHYLEVEYDLSKIMFICTANTTDRIPLPLLDRMEVIELSSYTEVEKYHIAKQFLIPKQLKEHGLKLENLTFTDDCIYRIIRDYTREAGVRNLEREFASVCRKTAKRLIGEKNLDLKNALTAVNLEEFLDMPKYRYGKAFDISQVGCTQGLAWTEVGGVLLIIECEVMPGRGKIIITGRLGDVMKESVHAVITYVRSIAERFGLHKEFLEHVDIHVHVPEGAIPKDGPSAGIAIGTSVVSLLTNIPVKNTVAMTGEITIRGKVLPIGGLKEKVIAAHRSGIYDVIIPTDNEKDLEEIQEEIRKKMHFHFVETFDEVLTIALESEINESCLSPVVKHLHSKANLSEKNNNEGVSP